jgi:Flp pilus assembly protein TadD
MRRRLAVVAALGMCAGLGMMAGVAAAQQGRIGQKTYRIKSPEESAAQTLHAQAQAAMDKQDYAAAADAWTKYIAIEPGDAYAHFQLGYAYTALKKTDEAKAEYQKAAQLKPDMPEAQLNLGLLLLDDHPAEAVAPLTRAAELMPMEVRPRILLGWAYEHSGKPDLALEQYREAAHLDPKNFDAHLFAGRILLAANRAADAEPQFRQALAIRGGSGPAALGLAQSLLAQKKNEPAASALDAYLKADPKDSATRVQYASLLLGLGRAEDALAQLDLAQAAGVNSPELWRLRANILEKQKNLAGAAEALKKAVAMQPSDAETHAHLGRVLLERKDYAGAARELAAAYQLDPRRTDVLGDLAATHYLAKDYSGAVAVLDELARHETPTAGQWYLRATCLDQMGDIENALAAYRKFLALNHDEQSNEYFIATARSRTLARELEDKKK